MAEQTTVVTDDGHWADGLITGETPENHSVALKGFETQEDLNKAYLGTLDHNWRDDFASDGDGGIDDKFKSTLERYASPADAGKAFREARATISGGAYKQAPGEGATEDDIKAYREANGIPLEAGGYMENLPEGLVVGDDDKEIMGDFLSALHSENVPPSVAHKAIEWYNGFAEKQQDQLAEIDHTHHTETEDSLRQEWGSDYRANINLVGALVENTFGEEIKEAILNARDMEGRAIMNIPGVVQGFAQLARQINPISQVVKPGGDPVTTLNDEIESIEKVMKEDRTKYNKDDKMQKRLLELYDIRIQHENRNKKTA